MFVSRGGSGEGQGVLEQLLAEGLVDLYQFEVLPHNDAAAVAPEGRHALLHAIKENGHRFSLTDYRGPGHRPIDYRIQL